MKEPIDWDTVRCPKCEPWEAKQEGTKLASEPCPSCKQQMLKENNAQEQQQGS